MELACGSGKGCGVSWIDSLGQVTPEQAKAYRACGLTFLRDGDTFRIGSVGEPGRISLLQTSRRGITHVAAAITVNCKPAAHVSAQGCATTVEAAILEAESVLGEIASPKVLERYRTWLSEKRGV